MDGPPPPPPPVQHTSLGSDFYNVFCLSSLKPVYDQYLVIFLPIQNLYLAILCTHQNTKSLKGNQGRAEKVYWLLIVA